MNSSPSPRASAQPDGPWPTDLLEYLGTHLDPPGSRQGVIVYGLAGAPGAGKTTLAGQLAAWLERRGRPAKALSLDDYYLDPASRHRLATAIHPALAGRGLPGTHRIHRLVSDLQALARGQAVALPRFDKQKDRPAEPEPVRYYPTGLTVILEGWCLGCRRQPAGPLPNPNLRAFVNDHIEGYRRLLEPWLARLVLLRPPDWPVVAAWRHEQSMRIVNPRHRSGRLRINRFLTFFQPLVRDQILGRWRRDLCLRQDNRRHITKWRYP